MEHKRLSLLLQKYVDNSLSADELEEFTELLHNKRPDDDGLLEAIALIATNVPVAGEDDENIKEEIFQRVIAAAEFREADEQPVQTNPVVNRFWTGAAAAILVLGILVFIFQIYKQDKEMPKLAKWPKARVINKIDPGNGEAILTLANGAKIKLNDSTVPDIAVQGNIHIVQQGRILIYDGRRQDGKLDKKYINTVSTPFGSIFEITLEDGTRIALNSHSKITFPVAFAANKREVTVEGEVYFEVAHDRTRPFIVKTPLNTVTVLGTHFNVRSYPGQNNITTLLQGRVAVAVDEKQVLLLPDEQAISTSTKQKPHVEHVNAEDAISWRKGYFNFNNTSVKEVMHTIAQWYNIEPVYYGDISNNKFGGTIARFQNIEKLLQTIELTGTVKFKKEGRRVIVMR